VDDFGGNSLLKKCLGNCLKLHSASRVLSITYALDGETERYRPVWAGRTVSVISPSFVFSHHLMTQKVILRRLLPGFYVLQFSVLLLGLTHYSYRAKELLVCWLLFCSLFAVLALMFLCIVFAGFAGQLLVNWVRVAHAGIPELLACLEELPQEVISAPAPSLPGLLRRGWAPMHSSMHSAPTLVSRSRSHHQPKMGVPK
jgi:hypothetical protein